MFEIIFFLITSNEKKPCEYVNIFLVQSHCDRTSKWMLKVLYPEWNNQNNNNNCYGNNFTVMYNQIKITKKKLNHWDNDFRF